jgi:hypothetical protein
VFATGQFKELKMASLYHASESTVKPTPICGTYLCHNHLDIAGRARLAVGLHYGAKQLVFPTMVQAAWLARVSTASAWLEHRRRIERAAPSKTSVAVATEASPSATNGQPPATQAPINNDAVIEFVRTVGVSRVLEAAVAVEAAQ